MTTTKPETQNPKPEPNPELAIAIIPARFASTRLPGKPLLCETGTPLIQHVVEQVGLAKRVGRVLVATDDARIVEAVVGFGGEAVMTRADHPNGTSRLAEVVAGLGMCAGKPTVGDRGLRAPLILNVQGDEPEIEPGVIDALVEAMVDDPAVPMGTVAAPLTDGAEIQNPNIVKVVCDQRGRALYFSRSAIPLVRDPQASGQAPTRYLRHLGIYAYRADFLPVYAALPTTPLEAAEKLEQLRALEHGYAIRVIQTDAAHSGIDTPQQYAAFVARYLASHPASA